MTIKYENGMDKGEVAYIALRGAQCNGRVGDEDDRRRCPFQSRYVVLGNHGVKGFCGHHVRDEWVTKIHHRSKKPPGRAAWDAKETRCDADVTTRSALDGQDIRCPFRASVVIYRNEEAKQFAACKHHAYTSWLGDLELDDETGADAESEAAEVPA